VGRAAAVTDATAGSAARAHVLLVHNHYQQAGGEDEVFLGEARLLERNEHRVTRYVAHNDDVGGVGRLALALGTVWNRASYAELRALIRARLPDLVHVHNTLPLISPSVYYAAAAEGVPVVQTVHNYRHLCANGLLLRDGVPCHDCVGRRVGLPGVVHACYRGSRAATTAVVAMTAAHRALGTWARRIAVYVALTDFARARLLEGGLPAERVVVKPNFVDPDPGAGDGAGGYALFIGRLAPEKGVRTLLSAWRSLGTTPPLLVVGDGPLGPEVARAAAETVGVTWLGRRAPADVLALVRGAVCVVCPSEWYETFGRVVVEAFAAGTPVVASDIGALAELVRPSETGLLFPPGDAQALAAAVRRLLADPAHLARMRLTARAEFERRFTAERNYEMLLAIYARALSGARGATPRRASP
jgi:glycosyltransferase involved in cell wall biosynthesis